jgi:deoxyhypusine synthase
MSKFEQIDLSKIKTISIKDRKSKVNIPDFAKVFNVLSGTFDDFVNSLPDILMSKDLKEFASRVAQAYSKKRSVVLMMGAHSIKVGLNPILIELIQKNIISSISLNGAGAIHDSELALWGMTSEDVAENLANGTFGMSKETAAFINETLAENKNNSDVGYGEALGKKLIECNAPNSNISLLAQAYKNNIPVTVHVGIGTDIIYQHPNMDAAAAGELSYRDFKILSNILINLGDGGIVISIGSAVILPEVFLKALTVVRNIGHNAYNFFTANFDMLQQYRPRVNIVQRPTQNNGKGYYFTGHHEIMIPLLIAMIKNEIGKINGR